MAEENQVKLIPHSEIQMLGVPLGNDLFVSDFVEKKLLGRLQKTVDRLVDFEDTQSATYLLRVSFSIVRAVHFMRTTPLEQWSEQAVKFDSMIRKAIVSILGFPMDDATFAQACLTPRLGGLVTQAGMSHRKPQKKSGVPHPSCLSSVYHRKRLQLSLTKRCLSI